MKYIIVLVALVMSSCQHLDRLTNTDDEKGVVRVPASPTPADLDPPIPDPKEPSEPSEPSDPAVDDPEVDPIVDPIEPPITPPVVEIGYSTWTFLAMGQSNMVGREDWPINTDKVMVYGGRRGPAYFFAREMSERTGNRIVVANCAVNGTAVESWLPGQQNYEHCFEHLEETQIRFGRGEIKGILFYQGESDAVLESRTAWKELFERIVVGARDRLDAQQLPVVYVQIGPYDASLHPTYPNMPTTSLNPPNWTHIQEEQARVFLPASRMVRSTNATLLDHVHLDLMGYELVGERMADAMLTLAN